jgi:predicted nucleic acid-binding protein
LNPEASLDDMIDTQIVSYAMKARWPQGVEARDISRMVISSVTAQEVLEVRDAASVNRPRYYLFQPMLPEVYGAQLPVRFDRDHRGVTPGRKNRTDQIILDFGGDFPTVVEYGHLMIGWLLKHKRTDVYARRIAHLEKRERRRLTDLFNIMIANELRCVSLDRSKAQLGVDLLRQYAMEGGNTVKSDFRNSLNDMLILASAIRTGYQLVTEDRALWRFAAQRTGLEIRSSGSILRIYPNKPISFDSRESKGYINRRWRADVSGHRIP